MKRFCCFFLLFVLSLGAVGQMRETAAFRVDKTVYFVSDLLNWEKDFRLFRCLEPHSILLTSLKLDNDFFVKLHRLDDPLFDQDEKIDLMMKLISFEKVRGFVAKERGKAQAVHFTASQLAQCGRYQDPAGKQEILASLMQIESFFRHRFILNDETLIKNLMPEMVQKYPNLSNKQLVEQIKLRIRLEQQASIDRFITSAGKKMSHDYFIKH